MQTTSASRQERRQRLKHLDKVVAGLEQHGFSPAPPLVELAALVAIIDGAIGTGTLGSSARAVRRALAVQDKSQAKAAFAKEAACRKGCAFCCSLYVSASAPQIFAIADHIRRTAPDLAAEIARIETADRATRGRDGRARFLSKAFCAFLVDNACSIYPVRPSTLPRRSVALGRGLRASVSRRGRRPAGDRRGQRHPQRLR